MYVYLVIFVVSVITVISCIPFGKTKEIKKSYIDFSDNWYSNNEQVNLSEIYKYDKVIKKLPQLEHDTQLYLIVKSININVYLEDKLIYECVDYNRKMFGKTPGTYFIKVNVSKEDSNKNIILDIDNIYNDESGRIKEIYIGDASEIVVDFAADNIWGTIIAAMITFIGAALIIVFIPLKIRRRIGLKMIYLGFFALAIGTFMFTDAKLVQLMQTNGYFYHFISEISMLLIVIPLMLFVDRAYEKTSNRICVQILCFISTIDFIVRYGLYLLNIQDFHESLRLTHFTYIICIIYILYICIKSFIDGTTKEKKHTIGFIIFSLFAFLDILLIYYGTMVETSFFTRIGVLAFLCLEGVQFALEYIKQYRNQKKIEFLNKLAYHDGLTELLNRTSFIEDIEKFKDVNTGLIAVMDINNLKYINDKFGHNEGDQLIINVSSAINDFLSPLGRCYRIGGDEFVFISLQENIEKKFKQISNKIKKDLKKYKNSNGYETSVAIGYSVINDENNIEIAFKKADENMYEDKQKMKKKK